MLYQDQIEAIRQEYQDKGLQYAQQAQDELNSNTLEQNAIRALFGVGAAAITAYGMSKSGTGAKSTVSNVPNPSVGEGTTVQKYGGTTAPGTFTSKYNEARYPSYEQYRPSSVDYPYQGTGELDYGGNQS